MIRVRVEARVRVNAGVRVIPEYEHGDDVDKVCGPLDG